MWEEACVFGVNDLHELHDEQYLECLRAVHDYWLRHKSQRDSLKLVRGSGPQSVQDRNTSLDNYVPE